MGNVQCSAGSLEACAFSQQELQDFGLNSAGEAVGILTNTGGEDLDLSKNSGDKYYVVE